MGAKGKCLTWYRLRGEEIMDHCFEAQGRSVEVVDDGWGVLEDESAGQSWIRGHECLDELSSAAAYVDQSDSVRISLGCCSELGHVWIVWNSRRRERFGYLHRRVEVGEMVRMALEVFEVAIAKGILRDAFGNVARVLIACLCEIGGDVLIGFESDVKTKRGRLLCYLAEQLEDANRNTVWKGSNSLDLNPISQSWYGEDVG